jgi:hypothetical protein
MLRIAPEQHAPAPDAQARKVRAFQSLDVVGQSTGIGRKLPELRSDETLDIIRHLVQRFPSFPAQDNGLSHGRLAPSTSSRACYIGRNLSVDHA